MNNYVCDRCLGPAGRVHTTLQVAGRGATGLDSPCPRFQAAHPRKLLAAIVPQEAT